MESRFSLVFEGGNRDGESIPLRPTGLKIGRKPGNDLVLDDANASGAHAEIVFEGGRVLLRDLGSTNGTILDGRKVEEVILSHDDKITIGHTFLRFTDAQAPAAAASEPHHLKLDQAAAGKRSLLLPVILIVALAGAGGFYFLTTSGGGEHAGTPVTQVPGNLVRGFSFETGENESASSMWNFQDGSFESFSVTTTRHSGSAGAGAMFGANEGGGATLARLVAAQPVPVEPGQRYRVAGWAKQVGQTTWTALGVRFSSSADGLVLLEAQSGGQKSSDESFRRIEFEADAPPGADRAAVYATASGADGRVVWDDLEMVKIGAAAPLPKFREFAYHLGSHDGFIHKIDAYLLRGFRSEAASDPSVKVEPTGNGFGVRIEETAPGRSKLRFLITQAALGDAGVMTLRGNQSASYTTDFQEDKVESLVFGGESNQTRILLSPASSVAGRAGADGFAIEIPWENALRLAFQFSFEEEKRRASELLLEAQGKEEGKSWGGSLALYGSILHQFPFDKRSSEKARARYDQLLREGQQKVAALEKVEEEARFFGLRDGFLQARRSAESLAKSYAGSEIAARAEATLARIQDGLKELQILLDREEAKRLKGLAAGLEAAKQRKLAAELREYLRTHYVESGENP